MAQTYDQHKAAVDTAMPTPTVVWEIIAHAPLHHNVNETAQFMTRFADRDFHYFASTTKENGDITFGVGKRTQFLRRDFIIHSQPTWEAAAVLFATYWDGVCDAIRKEIAARKYGQDVKDDAGAVREVSHDARLRTWVSPTDGQNEFVTVIILPAPFDPDVFQYTSEAYYERYRIVATREHSLSTVRWIFQGTVIAGLIPTFSLDIGFNYIDAVVTAQDGYTTRTYKLTINRVR